MVHKSLILFINFQYKTYSNHDNSDSRLYDVIFLILGSESSGLVLLVISAIQLKNNQKLLSFSYNLCQLQ